MQEDIRLLHQAFQERGRLSARDAERLDTLRHDLDQIQAIKTHTTNKLEAQLTQREDELKAWHALEREDFQAGIPLPKTELAEGFERVAEPPLPPPSRTPVNPELHAFMDRLEGRHTQDIHLPAKPLDVKQAFAEAAPTRTPEDEMNAFLDRMDDQNREREFTPSPTPKVEDEYATSLRSEFDAARGAGDSDHAARDAFLDRMGGMDHGLSLGRE